MERPVPASLLTVRDDDFFADGAVGRKPEDGSKYARDDEHAHIHAFRAGEPSAGPGQHGSNRSAANEREQLCAGTEGSQDGMSCAVTPNRGPSEVPGIGTSSGATYNDTVATPVGVQIILR